VIFVNTVWYFFGNMRSAVPAPLSEMALVVVAFLCGVVVGLERERYDKPAGLRTIVLICLGSAIFTLASVSPALGGNEPARVAAQIVTGVGFLGAGSILRDRFMITGLTTAATVWATAGVGMVVGAGYALAGVGLSLIILGTLSGLKRIEEGMAGPCHTRRVVVRYQPNDGRTRIRIQQALDAARGPTQVSADRIAEGGADADLTLAYCSAHKEHRVVLTALADISAVASITPEAEPT
jgi:putative Mg2+ transporter-C (MgtC) family protein